MTEMNLAVKQEQNHSRREQTRGRKAGGGDRGGMVSEGQVSRCRLLYMGWINSKVLLYSTGDYSQYPMISHSVKEHLKAGGEAVYMDIKIITHAINANSWINSSNRINDHKGHLKYPEGHLSTLRFPAHSPTPRPHTYPAASGQPPPPTSSLPHLHAMVSP